MDKEEPRIIVRIEISTLMDENNKLSPKRMDRLARSLSNLQNSGKRLILVSSGAIVLGTDKLNIKQIPTSLIEMQAIAAIGQAELIRNYQQYFGEYNQIVAQVLLTSDIIDSQLRLTNAKNTFERLLSMNIIPIINENDAISTSDIELDDNYPLALNVDKIVNADFILIKTDTNGNFIILRKDISRAILVSNENDLISSIDKFCSEPGPASSEKVQFPSSISKIEV